MEERLTEVAIAPSVHDPKKWDLRIMHAKWGTVGPRYLKGATDYPADYKELTLEEAIECQAKWQEFMDEQDQRLHKAARKAKRKR